MNANALLRRPVLSALLITIAFIVLAAIAGAAAMALFPQFQPEFIALVVMSLVVALALTALRWWGEAGFNGPAAWRDLRTLILPLVVFGVLPLFGGFNWLGVQTTLYLLVAYALTGFMEEGLMRGIVLRVLRPIGPVRAVLLTAVLFAFLHVGNVLYRNPAIVLAQMVGAFCDGVGLGALRLRTNTIWGVIAIHGLHDLMLRYSGFPTIPLDVVEVTIMLIYGLWLMRDRTKLEAMAEDRLRTEAAPA